MKEIRYNMHYSYVTSTYPNIIFFRYIFYSLYQTIESVSKFRTLRNISWISISVIFCWLFLTEFLYFFNAFYMFKIHGLGWMLGSAFSFITILIFCFIMLCFICNRTFYYFDEFKFLFIWLVCSHWTTKQLDICLGILMTQNQRE